MSATVLEFPKRPSTPAPKGPGTVVRVWRWVPEYVEIVAPFSDPDMAKFHASVTAPWVNPTAWTRLPDNAHVVPPEIVTWTGGEAS